MSQPAAGLWCIVANIASTRPGAEAPANGTKIFRPGAKVYLYPALWGDGYESIMLVGMSRGGRWVETVLDWKQLRNPRAKQCYEPNVLRREKFVGAWSRPDAEAHARELTAALAKRIEDREAAARAP